jgi:hypothetical protein
MPQSRYVSAETLKRMLVYLSVAVVVLLVADAGLQAMGSSAGVRRLTVLLWLVALPVIGWRVWKSGGQDGPGY